MVTVAINWCELMYCAPEDPNELSLAHGALSSTMEFGPKFEPVSVIGAT